MTIRDWLRAFVEAHQAAEEQPAEKQQARKLPPGWQIHVNERPLRMDAGQQKVYRAAVGAENGQPIAGDREFTEDDRRMLLSFLTDGEDPGDEDRKAAK